MTTKFLTNPSKYNNLPFVELKNKKYNVTTGWDKICNLIQTKVGDLGHDKTIIVVETYQGVLHEELISNLTTHLKPTKFIHSDSWFLSEQVVPQLVFPDVTEDRIFGRITNLRMVDFFDPTKVEKIKQEVEDLNTGTCIIYGYGSSLVFPESDVLIYADMPRWEIQLRMRQHLVDNLGVKNRQTQDWMLLYKQGYFVDWRVCDELKKSLFDRWDFVLDTTKANEPKFIEGKAILEGLAIAANQPFSLVPFFDPGPWGGQWMKEVCNLDPNLPNYAWSFNGVPEENSLLLKFGEQVIEIPSINVVFRHPTELLGPNILERFGEEFPIRFDFLDTMDGGNLSLQVHPLTEYIQEHFGMAYTQDESYYMMEAGDDAIVYLGLKEGVDPQQMIDELIDAQKGISSFDAEKHVQTWPVKKHDHFLIPAGTVHCSGKNSLVLEVSATPYIFTFKLWDWNRLGLDGKPRPINIEHGEQVIQWDRTTQWTKENLINRVEILQTGDGWTEERTGLHESEFIETRRHWFTKIVNHNTQNTVNVLCLIEGDEVIVESPSASFEPFIIHYAEVIIIPAAVGSYTIRPTQTSEAKNFATLKGYVRA